MLLVRVAGTQRLRDEVVDGVTETGFSESHALGELREEPDVGASLAQGLDRLFGKLHVVMAVGALNILMFEERRCGQENVGVVGGVGEELLVDDGEQIGAREAAQDRALVGGDGGWVGVVDEERADWGAVFGFAAEGLIAKFGERVPQH